MNKKEWYKDRILWKANQFRSLSQARLDGKNEDEFLSNLYKEYIDSDDEILLLFALDDKQKWTVVTTDKIMSYHDNNAYQSKLDNIEKLIEIKKDNISDTNLKYNSNILYIGSEKLPIWTPNAQVLFGIMNILRMFPLKACNVTYALSASNI